LLTAEIRPVFKNSPINDIRPSEGQQTKRQGAADG
jgi:hypothetical protein